MGEIMRTIHAQKLSKEAFSPYGQYYNLMSPEGYNLDGFFPDRVLMPFPGGIPAGFSPLITEKPAEYIIEKSEYHNYARKGSFRSTVIFSFMSLRLQTNPYRN